ncbi:MAG: heme-binding domain-containing protein [Algibacter sp.]|uniref:heme-binding domain-containing protein n=1 Tax=Algibacter sp. TaxID=1872428 RepID=UPI002620BBFD|nr:heme-binding domain-containing protein [Algibacter sp.]MDG1729422.1 heme-binding domain-containing protein [Algibacter sp.]
MSVLKKILIGLLLLFVIMQFFRPEKNIDSNDSLTTFIKETKPSTKVQNILSKACYDCHSNNTNYLWYNNITPINFWMANHIKEGKDELNFSEWASYSTKRKKHKMEEVYEEVEEKHMPISPYLITHSEANLTDEEIKQLVDWAKEQHNNY